MSADDGYVPLFVRNADDVPAALEEHEALSDGIPLWLASSIEEWLAYALPRPEPAFPDRLHRFMHEFERKSRYQIGGQPTRDGYIAWAMSDPFRCLTLIDFICQRAKAWGSKTEAHNPMLFLILRDGGSAWTVTFTGENGALARLTRRLPPGAQESAELAMAADETAGSLLRDAWVAIFGVTPNPSHGYRLAVRAIEAVAGPNILPSNPRATLGTVIAAMRDAPQKWTTVLDHAGPDRSVDTVREMCALLWTNQYDRHVTQGADLHVSQEEAEAAITVAVTLVHWFGSGAIRPAP